MTKNITIKRGNNNVFADLDFPNPDEMLVKAELTRQVNSILKERKLTETETSQLLKIDRDRLSQLQKGKLLVFSTEELLKFLLALDRDIEIVVRPKQESDRQAKMSISYD